MSSHLQRSLLLAAGFVAVAAVTGLILLSCTGPATVEKAADENALTAEQCIDNNSAAGSIEPLEGSLVNTGIVNKDLDEITLSQDMCEEVVERTPGGSPVERAAAVGNLTQELRIIENSMEEASQGDVDGDGGVDANDEKVAASASLAASHAARRTIATASEVGGVDGGVTTQLDAQPAAFLAQQQITSASAQGSTPASTVQPTVEATATASATASAAASATTSATASATASAEAGADQAGGSLRERAQDNASGAARKAGAGPKAATGGGQCAATVKLIDATLHVTRGSMAFKAPDEELRWKDRDEARLVIAPKALRSIEQIKREVAQAEGAGATEAGCLRLGNQMKPGITSDDGLEITWYDNHRQYVSAETSTTWRWEIGANERGSHPLYAIVTAYVEPEAPGDRTRQIEEPLYEGRIHVGATRGQIFTDFLGNQWQVFVPVFLTLLSAVVIPLVVFWWRRRNRPGGPGGGSGQTPPNDGWM